MTEHDLQTAIIALIRVKGGVATRVNSGSAIFKDGAGRVNVIKGAERGTSDILACYRGRYLAIEVKYGRGKPSLEQLMYAMDVWTSLYKLAPAGAYSTVFEFDDSVVVDKDQRFQQDMRLVQQGLMGKVEFRMRNMNEDEETAMKRIAQIDSEEKTVDLFGNS